MPATTSFSRAFSLFKRWLVLVLLSFLGLQVYFLARVAMMRYVDPQRLPASTLVGVPALVMDGLLIEVEAVAVIN